MPISNPWVGRGPRGRFVKRGAAGARDSYWAPLRDKRGKPVRRRRKRRGVSLRRDARGRYLSAARSKRPAARKVRGAVSRGRAIARRLPRNSKGRFMKAGARRRKGVGRTRRTTLRMKYGRYKAPRFCPPTRVRRHTPRYVARQRKHNRKRARKHLRAVTTIPCGALIGGLVRKNPRTGRMEVMSRAVVSNPRRRRRRRNARRSTAITVNPRRRRRSRRRNPSRRYRTSNPRNVVGMAKKAIQPAIAGVAAGAAAGILDTKILPKKPLFQGLAKFGAAIAGSYFLRNRPTAAAAWAGGMMGSIGYGLAVKMGGGMVANSKGDVLKGLADMAAGDDELASLLADSGGDLGDLVTAGELADGEVELADDEDMADLVMD